MGVQAVLDAVGETGVFYVAVGAAVKKSGLMDTQMFKTGMELNGLNLTRKQEHDWIELNEHVYGYSDGELGAVAKELTQNVELTGTGIGDTVKQEISEGIIQRVTAKGYDETQVRDAVQDLKSYQFDMEKVADHIIERVIDRKVSAGGIDDAIRNPLKTLPVKYDGSGRPSYKVIGKTATVSINPDTGRLITVYPTHKNLAEKLIKEGEK